MKKEQQEIIEKYVNSYNNFDVKGMTENLAKDVVFESITGGKVELRIEGIEGFVKQAELSKKYFKERTQTIESWEFKESKVTIEIAYKAILAIDFSNGLKAGETLEMGGISEFEFENEKIKSIRDRS